MRGRAQAIAVLLGALALGGCVSSEEPGPAPAATGADDPGFKEAAAGVRVPKVTGGSYGKARDQLARRGLPIALDPERDPKGCRVSGQLPEAGDVVEPKSPVTLSLACGSVDWRLREGDAWDAFSQAYDSGFSAGCRQLFALASLGTLADGPVAEGEGYEELDCEDALGDPEDPPDVAPKDPAAAGRKRGVAAGCEATFGRAGRDTLYDEGRPVRIEDCLARRRASGPTGASGATGPTGPTGEDGGYEAPAAGDYGVDAATWRTYSRAQKLAAAEAFTADNPGDCPPGRAHAEQVLSDADPELGASASGGTRVYDVLLRTCRAATR